MTITRGYVGAPGEQVHYRELGPADRVGLPTVVWLHQTASSSAMWERVLPRIDGVRHLALDTAGFGGSDPLPGAPGVGDYASRLAGAIDALTDGLADGPVVLVGHHTGAVIAGELAVLRPELLRGLVLIGCVVIETDEEQAASQATYHRWEIDARGDYVVEHLIPRLKKSVTRDDPRQMESELVSYLQAGPDYTVAYDAVYAYRAAERLPLVTTPTWCAVGEDEGDPMVRWTRMAAAAVPGASYTGIAGAGCELAFEEPDLVVAFVTKVLQELGTTRGIDAAAGSGPPSSAI